MATLPQGRLGDHVGMCRPLTGRWVGNVRPRVCAASVKAVPGTAGKLSCLEVPAGLRGHLGVSRVYGGLNDSANSATVCLSVSHGVATMGKRAASPHCPPAEGPGCHADGPQEKPSHPPLTAGRDADKGPVCALALDNWEPVGIWPWQHDVSSTPRSHPLSHWLGPGPRLGRLYR